MWIVAGADGLIGSRLLERARAVHDPVLGSTRRMRGRDGTLFADFSSDDHAQIVQARPDVVFVCAAMTSMQACDREPDLARRINVTAPVGLAGRLMQQGAFVVFLSSNTVFDGTVPFPDEDTPVSPVNEYGRQKVEAERRLRALPGADRLLAVARLSKVAVPDAGLPATFIHRLRSGDICEALDDLLLSPVSGDCVVDGLCRIAAERRAGVFHLTGDLEMSYAQFATELASRLGLEAGRVRSVSSLAKGLQLAFKPAHPALGSRRTREQGIEPETGEQFWARFCAAALGRHAAVAHDPGEAGR